MRWRDFGSETLRPELFVEVTDVGRAQESELRFLERYERTRFHSEKKKNKTHHQIIT